VVREGLLVWSGISGSRSSLQPYNVAMKAIKNDKASNSDAFFIIRGL